MELFSSEPEFRATKMVLATTKLLWLLLLLWFLWLWWRRWRGRCRHGRRKSEHIGRLWAVYSELEKLEVLWLHCVKAGCRRDREACKVMGEIWHSLNFVPTRESQRLKWEAEASKSSCFLSHFLSSLFSSLFSLSLSLSRPPRPLIWWWLPVASCQLTSNGNSSDTNDNHQFAQLKTFSISHFYFHRRLFL